MKRAILAACAMFFCVTAFAANDYSVKFEGDVAANYVDHGAIQKTATLLYANRKLSTVTSITGDLFLFHSNQNAPYLYEGLVDQSASPNRSGIYHQHYVKNETEEYLRCEFIGRWVGSYTMIVDVEFTQVGDDIYARAYGTHYPYNDGYSKIATTEYYASGAGSYGGGKYYASLNWNDETGMVRMSVHNVTMEFADPDLKCTVTYQDENGTTIGTEQVPYGEAAANPPTAPAKAGYVAAGWSDPLVAVKDDIIVHPVYHKLCTVRFLYPDGTQIGNSQTVEETKSATPPDMTGVTFNGTPFYGWIGNYAVVSDDTDFYGDFRFVPQWTTGSYDRSEWEPAEGNLLPSATVSNNAISYYTEGARTPDNSPVYFTDGKVPQVNTSYTGVVGVKSGSLEWQFTADKVYINAINVFTSWGDGGRDGIAIAQILYKTNSVSDWIEVAGPVDNNAVSYGVGDNSSASALFATLANSDGSFFIQGATDIKLVFAPENQQDNNGAGYVEIEAVGQTETQLAGGAYVTFVDWDDSVIQSNKVSFHSAAVPPADPVRQGYKFVGWDTNFSDVTVELTVKALYHKWCSVTFKDADGTTLDSQTVEETLAATAPDMTGRTYADDPFLCWDGDPDVISDDVVFTAIYGVLPEYVNDVIATGLVPDGALIWAGGASGNWDYVSRKWTTSTGILTTWVDGATAVFPVDAAVSLPGPVEVGGIVTMHQASSVTFSGAAITLTAPAKITRMVGGSVRFTNDVNGSNGITLENGVVVSYMPFGEANAIKLFENTALSDIDLSTVRTTIHYSRSGAAEKIVSGGAIADTTAGVGVNYFKSGDGWVSFECRAPMTDWYNNPYIAKVVLKQVGTDVYGYVEKAQALENVAAYSSIEVTGGAHHTIALETSAIASVDNPAAHRMSVEKIVFTDRDSLYNAATEFAGDYQVVGEGTMFGGDFRASGSSVTTPVILSDDGKFVFDSSAAQNFAMMVNARNNGSGYSSIKKQLSAGAICFGPSATNVTLTCSSEGMHRFYAKTVIYGKVTLASGNYHMFNENSYGVVIENGGVLSMTTGYGDYGHRDLRLTCNAGGTVNYNSNQAMGAGDNFAIFDGGTGNFTVDYSSSNSDIKHKDIRLSNGAEFKGVMMTWAHKDTNGKITVSGTTPSTISLQKIRMGQNGKTANSSNKMYQTLDVADVTGNADADLVVSSELYKHANASGTGENAKYFCIIKKGAGTVEFTGTSTNYNAAITLQAGTVAFASTAKLNGTALNVEGDATLAVEAGAEVAFLDCADTAWTADKQVTIEGSLSGHALRFGTDKDGLTADQLGAIVYQGKAGRVFLNANGYLRTKDFTSVIFK